MEGRQKLNLLPDHDEPASRGRFPSWLHRKLPSGDRMRETAEILSSQHLPTVCEEAKCPNRFECWSNKTATFLAMGKACTRNCGFCDIDFSKLPLALDEKEPERIVESVKLLGLRHVVITMVARDDLPDGGSGHLVKIIEALKKSNDALTIEVLTSDFSGNQLAWKEVLEALPHLFNHNIETVRELTPRVRHKATYERTLQLLAYASAYHPKERMKVKSGLMVGLGEREEEVFQTLRDLKEAGCSIVTIGQYLQANQKKLRVKSFVHPDTFKKYEEYGHSIGIPYVYSGPFIRSSYNAGIVLEEMNKKISS